MRGIAQKKKQLPLLRLLVAQSIDVLALQETMLSDAVRIGKAVEPLLSDYEVRRKKEEIRRNMWGCKYTGTVYICVAAN